MTEHKCNTGQLPRGWALARLGELAWEINPGFPSGRWQRNEGQGALHFRPMNIDIDGKVDLTDVKYVQKEDYDALRKGDVLFNNTNSPRLLGKTTYIKSDTSWAYSNHMTRIRFFPGSLEPGFIAHYLHHLFRNGFFMTKCVHHVNQASISTSFLTKDVCVPLPPLAEQSRIASRIEELFTLLDAGLEALGKVRTQLKRCRQAVLKYAFEGKLTEEWRKNHRDQIEPAFALLQRILTNRRLKWEANRFAQMKDKGVTPKNDRWTKKYMEPISPDTSNLPRLPDGWVWVTLDQLAWSVKDGPHYSPEYVDQGVPFITGGNVRPSGVDFDSAKRISPELHSKYSERCKPEIGDILYTKGGTTGVARVNTYNHEFSVWVHVAVLKLAPPLEPFYVQHMLNSPFCYEQAQQFTHGVGNQDLGLTRMTRVVLSLPPLAEQKEIMTEIDRHQSTIDEVERIVETNLGYAEHLRRSILKDAFLGKLVPQEPGDEPAEKLLERIKAERAKSNGERVTDKERNNKLKQSELSTYVK